MIKAFPWRGWCPESLTHDEDEIQASVGVDGVVVLPGVVHQQVLGPEGVVGKLPQQLVVLSEVLRIHRHNLHVKVERLIAHIASTCGHLILWW